MRFFSVFIFLILFRSVLSQEYLLSNVLYLPSHIKALVVSKSHQKLLVIKIQNGKPVVIDQMIAVTGLKFGDKIKKGDMRTPSGVYFPVSFKSKKILPSYYGEGAFPLNYPNALDRYFLRRDGDGIWIHGSPKKEILFFSSKGCVILKDKDLKRLSDYILLKKTPVVIQERFFYIPYKEYLNLRKKITEFIDRWKKAVLNIYNGDVSHMYDLYSPKFNSKYGTRYDLINHYKKLFYSYGGNQPFVKLINKMILYDVRKNNKKFFVVYFQTGFLSGDEIKTLKKVLYISANDMKVVSEENF
ncbi:L,D-transpeptidase family protein [Persephonella sp.]